MRWATRRHCHVERAACAWLIRRFLDPEAELNTPARPITTRTSPGLGPS
jgi:hypothetical protein